MKRLKSYLFYIAMLSGILMFSTSVFAIEGEGTAALPFLITNQEDLALIYDFPECHFKLMNDIEISSISWRDNIDFSGVFDGNNYKIKNFGKTLVSLNNGTIKNLTIDGGRIAKTNESSGKIINCFTYGNFGMGLISYNYGIIDRCGQFGSVSHSVSGGTSKTNITTTTSYAAGFVNYNLGNITNSFAICNVNAHAYSYYWKSASYASGFAYKNSGNIANCYTVSTTSATSAYGYGGTTSYSQYRTPFIFVNDGIISSCFYDITNSATNSATGVEAKSTLAMKMKQTYTNAGWDFENVWGISPTINDGYPYLLWEYPEENIGSAKVEISDVVTTDNSIKYISEATIEGEPDIDTFGTTFIPLQLLDNSKASAAVVQYNNAEYNISNGQTYGAALNNIPESCKDMYILGKSFIKDSNGNYTWSAAKYSSINNTSLHEAN